MASSTKAPITVIAKLRPGVWKDTFFSYRRLREQCLQMGGIWNHGTPVAIVSKRNDTLHGGVFVYFVGAKCKFILHRIVAHQLPSIGALFQHSRPYVEDKIVGGVLVVCRFCEPWGWMGGGGWDGVSRWSVSNIGVVTNRAGGGGGRGASPFHPLGGEGWGTNSPPFWVSRRSVSSRSRCGPEEV